MDYTLAVLTHGRNDTLARSLNSFVDKVGPPPSRILIHVDGPLYRDQIPDVRLTADIDASGDQRGFCAATRHLWRWASQADTEFVFWLEHDFVFLRRVDLVPLADQLRADPKLAQMQLMRTPVSVEEVQAGGLYESRPGEYEKREAWQGDGPTGELSSDRWLLHRSYLTTNPSLMRTAWMAGNQWPDDDEPYCEGRFGIEVLHRGFHFGVWGHGDPWVEHIGWRTGFGY